MLCFWRRAAWPKPVAAATRSLRRGSDQGDGYRASWIGTDPRIRIFNDEELAAVVNEAHKAGLWVVAHAHGDAGAAAAVRAGVHCIEHGTYLATTPFGL